MTDYFEASWDTWITRLDESRRQMALRLRDRFMELGTADPEGWSRSEIGWDEVNQSTSQLGRYLVLRATWRRMTDTLDATMRSEVTARLVADGTDVERLRRVVQVALGRLAFDMLYLLDDPDGTIYDDGGQDVDEGDPHWRLMEVNPSDDSLTGRDLGGLHESWGELDPARSEGQDWC